MATEGQDKIGDGRSVAMRPRIVETRFLHPGYEVDLRSEVEMTSTGLLATEFLKCRFDGTSIWVRWGEKPSPVLKFDLKGANETRADDFKHERKGCAGHHSTHDQTFVDGHRYEAKIAICGDLIFEGTLQVGLTYSVSSAIGGRANVEATTEVVRVDDAID